MSFSKNNIFKLVYFFRRMMFYVPILSLYLVKNEVSLQDIVISQSVYTVAMLLAEIPSGVLADKFGQKWSTSWGMLFYAFGYFTLFLFPTTLTAYVMNILWGVGGAFLSGSLEALVYEDYHSDTVPEKDNGYQQYYSRLNMFGRIGAVVSSLVTGVLLQFIGEFSYKIAVFLTMSSYLVSLYLIRQYQTSTVANTVKEGSDSHLMSILKEGFSAVTANNLLILLTYLWCLA